MLGCSPVVYRRKIWMVKYWLSLYNFRVRNIPQDAGLNYIWQNPCNVYLPEVIETLRVRLQDQHWYSLLQATTGKLWTYKQFKRYLTFEPYLYLPPYLRRPLTRLRITISRNRSISPPNTSPS